MELEFHADEVHVNLGTRQMVVIVETNDVQSILDLIGKDTVMDYFDLIEKNNDQ